MNAITDDILKRLQRLEDVQCISQMIAGYGPAADACLATWLEDFWSDDVLYDMGALGTRRGKEELMSVYHEPAHQTLVASGCAHVGSVPNVTLDGDNASAVQYATLFRCEDGRFELFRLAASSWTFRRRSGGGWEATGRTLKVLDGAIEARAILAQIGKSE
jgi:hypothetical protein